MVVVHNFVIGITGRTGSGVGRGAGAAKVEGAPRVGNSIADAVDGHDSVGIKVCGKRRPRWVGELTGGGIHRMNVVAYVRAQGKGWNLSAANPVRRRAIVMHRVVQHGDAVRCRTNNIGQRHLRNIRAADDRGGYPDAVGRTGRCRDLGCSGDSQWEDGVLGRV